MTVYLNGKIEKKETQSKPINTTNTHYRKYHPKITFEVFRLKYKPNAIADE
jgi:hypothetical protein